MMAMNSPALAGEPARALRERVPGARRRAREFALQGIYAWLLRKDEDGRDGGEVDAHIRSSEGFEEADLEWYATLLHGVIRDTPALRARFQPYLSRKLVELSPVEHAILLIGSYELLHHIEVPYRVVIDESVELAKAFGGTDGFKFVNGVLDRVAAEVRAVEFQAARRRRRPGPDQ